MITTDWIERLTTSSARRGIAPSEAAGIVAENYCRRMRSAGLCPLTDGQDCSACAEDIAWIFYLKNARNPAAYLHILARDRAALRVDQAQAQAPAVPASEGDPFSALAGQL